MRRWYLVVTAAACLFGMGSLCKEKPAPERQWDRGAFKPYLGKSFVLAAGLDVQHVYGAEDVIPKSELPLDMLITNTTGRRINSSFPAGLVFEPTNHDYQYMILLQPFVFTVPASSETTLFVPTYCCNWDLDEPDEESNYREFEIQVWERELNELIDILRDKRLEGDTAVPLAQDALFEITDGEGLTEATRAQLDSLP